MNNRKELKHSGCFANRLQEGNWWQKGNECLNMHDINKPPKYYTGTEKQWIEELTTYIYLYPVEWQSIYEQYQALNKKSSELQFYRNEEGYLRRAGLNEVYLKVTGAHEPLSREALHCIGEILEERAEELFYSCVEYAGMDEGSKARWIECRKEDFRKRCNKQVAVIPVESLDESDFAGDELYFDWLNNLYIIL